MSRPTKLLLSVAGASFMVIFDGAAFQKTLPGLGMTFGVAAGATLLDYATTHATGTASERTAVGVRWALSAGAASALMGAERPAP